MSLPHTPAGRQCSREAHACRARFSELHGSESSPTHGAKSKCSYASTSRRWRNSTSQSCAPTGSFASPAEQKSASRARVAAASCDERRSSRATARKILSRQRVGANGLRVMLRARCDRSAARHCRACARSAASRFTARQHRQRAVDRRARGVGEVRTRRRRADRHHRFRHRLHARRLRRQRQPGRPTTRNNPNIIEPGTFPTAKVKGGYDFAGSELQRGRCRQRAAARSGSARLRSRRRPRHARRRHRGRLRRSWQRRPGRRAGRIAVRAEGVRRHRRLDRT